MTLEIRRLLDSLRKALDYAYICGSSDAAFFRGGGEYVPSPFVTLRQLAALLAASPVPTEVTRERCPAMSTGAITRDGTLPDGVQCGLDKDHSGNHTILIPTSAPWASPVLQGEDTKEEDLSRVDRQSPSIGQDLSRSPQPDGSQQWRPIETVADDADFVVGAWPCAGTLSGYDVGEMWRDFPKAPWFCAYDNSIIEPRFWMPLPQPPGTVSDEVFAVDRVAPERPQEPLRAQPLDSPTLPPLLLQEDTNEEETTP